MTPRSADKFVRDVPHAILPGHRVVQTTEVARIGAPHVGTAEEATVELIREGDVVKAIDITCSCGEKIRIWCSYGVE
jgi:hypothetical protein